PLFLAQRGVSRERVRIGLDAVGRWDPVADRDDRAPLAEDRTEVAVFDEALAEVVEPLGDDLGRGEGQGLGPDVRLDARKDPLILEDLDQWRPIRRLLADRLVVEDHPTDELGDPRSSEEELAIGAAIRFGVLDTDRVEAFLDGARALVGRKDALARSDESARGLCEIPHCGVQDNDIARLARRLSPGSAGEEQSDSRDDQEDRPELADRQAEQEDQSQRGEHEAADELATGLGGTSRLPARVAALER